MNPSPRKAGHRERELLLDQSLVNLLISLQSLFHYLFGKPWRRGLFVPVNRLQVVAHHLFVEGRVEESYALAEKLFKEAMDAGLSHQYASPIFLEAYYKFYRLGFKPIFGHNFQTEVIRLLQ